MANDASKTIHMSYAELIATCDFISSFMTRDLAEFISYGIDAAVINNFKSKHREFIDFPSDIMFESVKLDATDTKNKLADELKTLLRSIIERARLAFGTDNSKFSLFYIKELWKLSDSELYFSGRLLKLSAETYAAELLGFGLTPEMIDLLETKTVQFGEAIFSIRKSIVSRDEATKLRAEKALELYGMLMSYCETGKVIWSGVNEAYYNDYIIFGSPA